jgi:hypothetical protein
VTAPDLDLSVEELLAQRYAAGRRERGLGAEAPFAWDRGVGVDELEELIDAAIYRRHWSITRDPAPVPGPPASMRLRLGDSSGRQGVSGAGWSRDRRTWGSLERRSWARRG